MAVTTIKPANRDAFSIHCFSIRGTFIKTFICMVIILLVPVYPAQDSNSIAVLPLKGDGFTEEQLLNINQLILASLNINSKLTIVDSKTIEKWISAILFQKDCSCEEVSCAVQRGFFVQIGKIVNGDIAKVDSTYCLTLYMIDMTVKRITAMSSGFFIGGLTGNGLPKMVNKIVVDLLANNEVHATKTSVAFIHQPDSLFLSLQKLLVEKKYSMLDSAFTDLSKKTRQVNDTGYEITGQMIERMADPMESRHIDDWASYEKSRKSGFVYLPLTIRGNYYINRAWEARGSGRANTVTQEGWKKFDMFLDSAQTNLMTSVGQHDYPYAYALLIACGTGKNYPESTVTGYFKHALKEDPHNHSAFRRMFNYSLPKWHGTKEKAYDLAKKASLFKSNNPILCSFLPLYHYEIYLFRDFDTTKPYFSDNIWKEIEISCAYLKSCFPKSTHFMMLNAQLAYWAGKYYIAEELFDSLNGRNAEFPYFGNATSYYATWADTKLKLKKYPEAIAGYEKLLNPALNLNLNPEQTSNVYLTIGNLYNNIATDKKTDAQTKADSKGKQAEFYEKALATKGFNDKTNAELVNWLDKYKQGRTNPPGK